MKGDGYVGLRMLRMYLSGSSERWRPNMRVMDAERERGHGSGEDKMRISSVATSQLD